MRSGEVMKFTKRLMLKRVPEVVACSTPEYL
jgi:hypothetical protein